MTDRPQSVINVATVRTAILGSLVKLDPRHDDPQPGDVRGRGRRHVHDRRLPDPGVRRRTAGRRRRAGLVHRRRRALALADSDLRQPRRGTGRGPRQGPGGRAARDAYRDRRPAARRLHGPRDRAPARRRRRGRGGRGDSGRRDRGRGHRLGRRVGGNRRVRPCDPGGRRRSQRRHRRHPGALGPDRGRGHAGAGQELPRPDDRSGRGRRAGARPRTRSRSGSCSRG